MQVRQRKKKRQKLHLYWPICLPGSPFFKLSTPWQYMHFSQTLEKSAYSALIIVILYKVVKVTIKPPQGWVRLHCGR